MKKNYFIEKFNAVDEEHNSFNNTDLYANNWAEFTNSDLYADGTQNGNAMTPESDPYIISLYNSTGSAISDVSFLDAAKSINATNDGVTLGVTCTYDISGTTYAQFLQFLMTQATLIGKTYIECSSSTQLTKTLTITTSQVRGKSSAETYSPTLNPFANQTTVLEMTKKFVINGWTKLTIASLAAGTTVTYRFYPMKEASSTSGLTGKQANVFGDPQISGMKILGQ